MLVGGDPGIGKSTLLLQVAARIASAGGSAVYVSGEEAADQVRLRARRLGLGDAPVQLAAATSVRDILTTMADSGPPSLLVIDSIQTMHSDLIEGAPGTVSQVRASAHELIRFAKASGTAVVLVGHVTKDGTIAGPRVLEHMVDTVLGFEGERSHQYRILRASKNRFGGTDEIGVFAMDTSGLVEVPNPSTLFLTERGEAVSGTSVFPALEGTRPVLVEIQALTVRLASGATPRRAAVGWDSGRLAMVLAVLEARCGMSFASAEVYLNIAGGYRLSDPAADLAVAAALVSALSERPVPANCVVLGRGRAVGRDPSGRAHGAAIEGSGQAWVRKSLGSGRGGGGRGYRDRAVHQPARSRRAHPGAIVTALDIFVILLLGGGAVIGFVRGFVHEVLSLFAWIAAIAALKLFHTPLQERLVDSVGTEAGAAALAFALLFVPTYILVKLIARQLGKSTRRSVVGPVDRVLGGGFGMLKGLIGATLFFLLANLATDLVYGPEAERPRVDDQFANLPAAERQRPGNRRLGRNVSRAEG